MIINTQIIGLNKHTAKEDYIEYISTREGENIVLRSKKRGYGVDVEALRDRSPLKRSTGKGPKMGSHGCVSIRFLAPYLVVWGYVGIYRRKKYVGGATWGPRGWRARPGWVGAPSYLVPSWLLSWHRVQVLWITFVPKITFLKVSFRLDFV